MSYGDVLGIDPSAPDPGNVTSNYLQLVNGFNRAAPSIYSTEATYQPLYAQLGLQNLNTMLNGSKGTPGFLNLYANDIMPALTKAQTTATTAQRTANVADMAALGPGAVSAWKSANPSGAAVLDELTNQASQGLAAGSALTPEQLRLSQQTTRAGQSARGLGWGPSDVFQESLAGTAMGNQLLQQRQNFAAGVSNLNDSVTGAALGTLGGQSGVTGQGMGFQGQAMGDVSSSGPRLFTPAEQTDLFGTAYNANAAANISSANNAAALIGGAMKMAGGASY